MTRLTGVLCAAVLLFSGCGRSAEQERQEQAARQTEQAAQEAAEGLEQMAKGLEGLAAGMGGGEGKAVDPVSFRDLQALFPALDGWEQSRPTGERMSSPFPFSQAEVTYSKGDSTIDLKMIDSGFNQLLLTPYAMFLQAGYEKETSEGYEKSATIAGQPGWERWSTESKDGEVNALVGKRFLVTIEGRNVDDVKVLHDVAGRIDMRKLASLQ